MNQESLIRLVSPFFAQGAETVYVASCCNKLFAGVEPPVKCRTCGKTPEAVSFASLEEVDISRMTGMS